MRDFRWNLMTQLDWLRTLMLYPSVHFVFHAIRHFRYIVLKLWTAQGKAHRNCKCNVRASAISFKCTWSVAFAFCPTYTITRYFSTLKPAIAIKVLCMPSAKKKIAPCCNSIFLRGAPHFVVKIYHKLAALIRGSRVTEQICCYIVPFNFTTTFCWLFDLSAIFCVSYTFGRSLRETVYTLRRWRTTLDVLLSYYNFLLFFL